jgi:hypothetical protein
VGYVSKKSHVPDCETVDSEHTICYPPQSIKRCHNHGEWLKRYGDSSFIAVYYRVTYEKVLTTLPPRGLVRVPERAPQPSRSPRDISVEITRGHGRASRGCVLHRRISHGRASHRPAPHGRAQVVLHFCQRPRELTRI